MTGVNYGSASMRRSAASVTNCRPPHDGADTRPDLPGADDKEMTDKLFSFLYPAPSQEFNVAKKTKRKKYKPWLATELRALKKYSREKLPVAKIEKLMKRTAGMLRQKAFSLGLPLGHRR